ncbi:MAG: MFS transporter [Holosporales bacterium]|nr:MFS transporter [Holosporales bacterium]
MTCWLFYLLVYIVRVEPSVLSNCFMDEFKITSSVYGFIVSIAYIPYIIMQIPCGIIADKLGTKSVLISSCIFLTMGTFIFGAAGGVLQLEIGRFFIGLASSAAFLCCIKMATDCFEPKKQGMMMGITMSMGCLGGITGTAPVAYLVNLVGWRIATYSMACFGVLIGILAVVCMSNKSGKSGSSNTEIFKALKLLVSNRNIWVLGFSGAMAYLPLSALAELWIVPFIEKRFSISTEIAAAASITIFIGYGIGSVFSPWVAQKIASNKNTLIIGLSVAVCAFWTALFSDAVDFYACLGLLFVGSLCAASSMLCFPMACSNVDAKYGGTASGVVNMLIMCSGLIFQPALGKLLDFFRGGLTTAEGLPIYTIETYRGAMRAFVIAMIFGLIITFFVSEKKTHTEK